MDIGTEELSDLEVVGTLARMHLKRSAVIANAPSTPVVAAIAEIGRSVAG